MSAGLFSAGLFSARAIAPKIARALSHSANSRPLAIGGSNSEPKPATVSGTKSTRLDNKAPKLHLESPKPPIEKIWDLEKPSTTPQ